MGAGGGMHEDARFSLFFLAPLLSGTGKEKAGLPPSFQWNLGSISVKQWVGPDSTQVKHEAHSAWAALGGGTMCTAAEKLRYVAVPVVDKQSSVRVPGLRVSPYGSRDLKATWKK